MEWENGIYLDEYVLLCRLLKNDHYTFPCRYSIISEGEILFAGFNASIRFNKIFKSYSKYIPE
jgi:hypothetical protein